MLLNEQIKKEMKKCETADECRMFMQKALTHYKYKTLYNMCYSDYGQTEFYEQIKAYQGSDDDFIVLGDRYLDPELLQRLHRHCDVGCRGHGRDKLDDAVSVG